VGKQTAIALTPADERAFLEFLRSIAEVRLLVSSGPTAESLSVEGFDSIEGYATSTFGILPSSGRRNMGLLRETRPVQGMVIGS